MNYSGRHRILCCLQEFSLEEALLIAKHIHTLHPPVVHQALRSVQVAQRHSLLG